MRYEVRNSKDVLIAVHRRIDQPDGTKKVWWEGPDGTTGLPEGVGVTDLPLFGSELVRTVALTKYLVVTEGEKAALALRAGGIPALATVTGAASCPSPKAVVHVAFGAKFILWPDHDDIGKKHMKALAQTLLLAGAREVLVIDYQPTVEEAKWAKGTDAADVVTPETAKAVLSMLVSDWSAKARRAPKRDAKAKDKALITIAKQHDKGSVVAALDEVFGITVVPGKSTKCPMHDDRAASLSVLKDDLRAICHAGCSWASPGVTASDIRGTKVTP